MGSLKLRAYLEISLPQHQKIYTHSIMQNKICPSHTLYWISQQWFINQMYKKIRCTEDSHFQTIHAEFLEGLIQGLERWCDIPAKWVTGYRSSNSLPKCKDLSCGSAQMRPKSSSRQRTASSRTADRGTHSCLLLLKPKLPLVQICEKREKHQ